MTETILEDMVEVEEKEPELTTMGFLNALEDIFISGVCFLVSLGTAHWLMPRYTYDSALEIVLAGVTLFFLYQGAIRFLKAATPDKYYQHTEVEE